MEAKEKQFIITEKWLEEMRACKAGLQAFKQHFPNGGEALEVLKRCGELDYTDFGIWLVEYLPPIYPPLVLNTFVGNLFYPGDVHIKGDISTEELIYIKGNLKVDGKLTVNKYGVVYSEKYCVNAGEIDISEYARISSNTKANSISMRGFATIVGEVTADNINLSGNAEIIKNVIAKVINFKGGFILGDVDADEIINNDGWIEGDVNTIKIKNINGGEVGGKITYKC
ncbi:Integral membrane protein CcmA involved in cell shape determination [Snodgrassella alvi SCGC AB-598-O02]|nr:Integral membrane protein CcmA involved in cell shape determination [Snodgrassella alvi SCGC AB-598-O02]